MAQKEHPEDKSVFELLAGAHRGPQDPDVELARVLVRHLTHEASGVETMLTELVQREISN